MTGNKIRRRKKGPKREKGRNKGGPQNGKKPPVESETKTVVDVEDAGSDTEEGSTEKVNSLDISDPSSTERKKSKTSSKTSKNMARFVPRLRFVNPYQQKGSEHDLELIEEETHDAQSTQQQHISDGDENDDTNTIKESYLVPGGFETGSSASLALPERNRQSPSEFSISSNEAQNLQTNDDESDTTELNDDDTFDYDYDDEDEDDEEDDDDDDFDEDEEADDVSSSDSAFTDIEADSVIDSSLLYPFDNESGFPFDNNNVLESKISRRKKLRINSYE